MMDSKKERCVAALGILTLLAVLLASIFEAEPYPALTAILGIGLTGVPMLLRRHACLPLPWMLTALTAAVTFLHSFGILAHAYDKVWWWDILTHVAATVVLAIVVNIIILVVGRREPRVKLPLRYIPLVSLGLIISLGVLWEVLEFAFDGLLGMTMQYDLHDTAIDLSMDILGGVLVAILIPPYMEGLDENYGLCEYLSPLSRQ
ncbi:MAG: hypothetical protein GX307_08215 [Euryarchaeota archaeon]|nr:hypothetical protein [Euryarchaeota archaeon]